MYALARRIRPPSRSTLDLWADRAPLFRFGAPRAVLPAPNRRPLTVRSIPQGWRTAYPPQADPVSWTLSCGLLRRFDGWGGNLQLGEHASRVEEALMPRQRLVQQVRGVLAVGVPQARGRSSPAARPGSRDARSLSMITGRARRGGASPRRSARPCSVTIT